MFGKIRESKPKALTQVEIEKFFGPAPAGQKKAVRTLRSSHSEIASNEAAEWIVWLELSSPR
jgi:hypothetical protein